MRGTDKLMAALALVLAVAAVLGIGMEDASHATSASDPADYGQAILLASESVQETMDRHHLPSAVVALVDDQETVWQAAYGQADLQTGTMARSDTVYRMWSLAKLFTAIETMRLVEEGLVELDAPVSDYLPGFSIGSRFADGAPITVRSILSHRSGLPRNPCHAIQQNPGDPAALHAMAASVVDCQAVAPVGERYHYSNLGPNVLGAIIQEARGQNFIVVMRESLLRPMGMTNSAYHSLDIAAGSDLAPGYEYYKREYYPIGQGDIRELASGNLYSTLEDMTVFTKFVFRDGEVNGQQLIRPETLWAMYEEQFPDSGDPQPMGLGCKVARVLGDELLVWHDGGAAEGTGSLVAMLPERKLGVILLANGKSFEGSLSLSLALEILAEMLEAKAGPVSRQEPDQRSTGLDRETLAGYQGRYTALGITMKVTLRGKRLKAKFYGLPLTLAPAGEGTFKLDHWLLDLGLSDWVRLPMDLRDLRFEFAEEDDGTPVMFINFGGIFYERCPRYPDHDENSEQWQGWVGQYDLSGRLPRSGVTHDVFSQDEIQMDDGILAMPGVVGPIAPLSDSMAIIQGGPFAGEVIERDSTTGWLYHQWVVYKPVDS